VSANAIVSLLPPGDALPEVSGVNLYLYRVTESPFTRNRPWPGDRVTAPSNRPALGLQLDYLLTPLGSRPVDANFSEGDDAHTMLGLSMSTLQENPILNNVHLPALPASGTLNATPGFDADAALPPFLLNSYEQIKIMLSPTNLEELSKIWATINQPYRLSVAYEISLVEITPTPPPPVNGGIVLSTSVTMSLFEAPWLDSLNPSVGALAHVDGGGVLRANTLAINGSGFSVPGLQATVTIGGQPAAAQITSPPSGASLTVALPLDVEAGPQTDVQVVLGGRTSPPLSFTVSPWLASVTPIRTDLPANQRLALRGAGFSTTPQGVRFDGVGAPSGPTPFDPGVTDTSGSIIIPSVLPNGIYQMRVVLSDAVSSASNSRTLEIIPRIDSTALTVSSPPAVHILTINGARLNGTDIRLIVDGVTYQAPPNANAAQLVFGFGRLLSPGSHALSVGIDGHMSHGVDLEA
jgi:hypothetical protein